MLIQVQKLERRESLSTGKTWVSFACLITHSSVRWKMQGHITGTADGNKESLGVLCLLILEQVKKESLCCLMHLFYKEMSCWNSRDSRLYFQSDIRGMRD